MKSTQIGSDRPPPVSRSPSERGWSYPIQTIATSVGWKPLNHVSMESLVVPVLPYRSGTTNDSIDTWFNGFHPTLVAIVWMGYDQPRSLGDRETGGGLSLPI